MAWQGRRHCREIVCQRLAKLMWGQPPSAVHRAQLDAFFAISENLRSQSLACLRQAPLLAQRFHPLQRQL
jgi:hypothetical protein